MHTYARHRYGVSAIDYVKVWDVFNSPLFRIDQVLRSRIHPPKAREKGPSDAMLLMISLVQCVLSDILYRFPKLAGEYPYL